MQIKFSQDVVPLSTLKINPGKVVNHSKNSGRAVLITSRGRGVAVMQGLEAYENTAEELAFFKAVAKGLLEVNEGKHIDLEDAKTKLGL